ncbi:F-type conjugal transfer protein TrbF [Salmonella enterica]|nr:conjugal transfer protein TrbF [Salmonella enterica]EBR3872923.1 conjugal transfer protein TrbF [Salmonella enterica subsp. enterica]EDS6397171.1 F-type conjugal transfer protein TrbF [Salmonella enterica subsp. enterica serovar Minnesota]EBP1381685.1 conjugal transfer protein TrbF [Salmonella enterica]EDV3901678.1 F-type conjugal transfer protein TrbF [Salmonella enterica subsp. enterica serovar Minnesota]
MNYQRKLIMKENKKNQKFKIRKIKRDIGRNCDNAIKHFGLFVIFFIAGLLLCHGMHAISSACIDSWKTDPELNNSIYMWNILMYAIPYTLYALAAGFLVTFFLCPMYELIYGNIGIFLLKCRMRRENKLREGKNDATH